MTTIKASNVWDDDYIAPDEMDKLRGECARLYMEKRDISVRLDNIKYRQARCRRIYAVCVIITAILLIAPLLMCAKDLFIDAEPVSSFSLSALVTFYTIAAVACGISSTIFFSAMSVHSFWAKCANILRIEKLEMQRLSCIREQNALEIRLKELEEKIGEGKRVAIVAE